MKSAFFLDPLEGEKKYPDEAIYEEYLGKLPSGATDYRFAHGRTEMNPTHPLVVGCCYTFQFTYFPIEKSLPAGTIVAFSIPRTWSQPQIDSHGPGFVVAERSNSVCKVSLSQNENLQWWIKAHLDGVGEPANGWVRIHYSEVTIQRFPQDWFGNWRSAMRTVIDLGGEGVYSCVPAKNTVKPVIIAAPPARFNVAVPAVARSGETIRVRATSLDYCDNRAYPSPTGEIFLAEMKAPFTPIATAELKPEDNGYIALNVVVPDNEERFRTVVSNRRDNLHGMSSATVVDNRAETMRVYFGDIHAKTKLSDGLKTPMEYFEHARDVALTDFGAIADHNCVEASRTEGPFQLQMSDETFAEIQTACETFNQPGRFVTLQGFEQNRITGYSGHRNIYFRGICPGLFRGDTLEELYEYLEGHDALVIPHHPIIWKTRVHFGNPIYERVLEMYSMHCSSEEKGSPINNFATTINKAETGISAREVLAEGYRVGFIAASDNHNGAPGLSARPSRFTNIPYRGGLAAVLASSLTRENIFDGLYNRRCYATTGSRLYLDWRMDGHLMGSEIVLEHGRSIHYEITISATSPIASVEFILSSKIEQIFNYSGQDFVRLEGELPFTHDCWIYVRITQIDRHMAWSSPIWINLV
jgi:predicted metal-dependent phosphoesterase TrpH